MSINISILVIVAVAVVVALLYLKARSGESKTDLNDIDSVLAEVEIYLSDAA